MDQMMNQVMMIECDATLEYSAGNTDREILITESPAAAGQPESLSNCIARKLGFPNETEFDMMLQNLREQQASGTYVADERDAIRKGVRLLVTVEVLDSGTE